MTRILLSDVQAWCEPTKLTVVSLDATLDTFIENYVIAKLEPGFNASGWVDSTTTPEIVKQVMAMKYASVLYDRQYSEDDGTTSPWSARLDVWADDLIDGMLVGSVTVDGYVVTQGHADPVGYPTDSSSSPNPSYGWGDQHVQWSPNHVWGDPAAQPPLFSVGMRF
jgi:hypothetical protein